MQHNKENEMKMTLTLSQFAKGFYEAGCGESFTPAGLEALYNYLSEVSPEMEFDAGLLDYTYVEFESWSELLENGYEYDSLEDLAQATTVIKIPGTEAFIINGEF